MKAWSRERVALLIAALTIVVVGLVLLSPRGAVAKVHAPPSRDALAPPDDGRVRSLRVLTLNMMGLPQPLGGDETRYDDIAAAISEYDIVAIQEAFTKEARDALRSTSFPHQKYGNYGELPEARLGDGLVVLSRFPIASTAFTTYDACYWTDCLARKGVLLVRVDVQGVEVDVYTTHLQSLLDDPDGRSIRAGQVAEFKAFVRRTSRGNPTVFLGDFNARSSQYTVREMVGALGARDLWAERRLPEPAAPAAPATPATTADEGGTYCTKTRCERIDYIFARPGRYHDVRTGGMNVRLKEEVRGRQLSDHFGLDVQIDIVVRPTTTPVRGDLPAPR